MARKRAAQPELRPRLTLTELESLFIVLLRHPDVLAAARQLVEPKHLTGAAELHLQVLYRALLPISEDGRALTYQGVRAAVLEELPRALRDPQTRFDAQLELLTETDDPDGIPGLVFYAFTSPEAADIGAAYGRKLLTRLHEERVVWDATVAAALTSTAGADARAIPANVGQLLDEAREKLNRGSAAGTLPLYTMRATPGKSRSLETWELGMDFLTKAMGGMAAREVYLLIAPTGEGKTAMVLQLATRAAHRFRRAYLAGGSQGTRRAVFYFHYELSEAEIRTRLWAHAALVDRSRMERMDPERLEHDPMFTTRDTPSEERPESERVVEEYAGEPFELLGGEHERLVQAIGQLEDYLYCFELDVAKGHGSGLVDEIAAMTRQASQQLGVQPGLVIVDYIGYGVENYMGANSIVDDAQMRLLLNRYIVQIRNRVANEFDTACFLLHQVAGAETKKNATSRIHQSDAQGSKSLFNNVDCGFALGTRDATTSCQNIFYLKTRRSDERGKKQLLHFDGRFGRYAVTDRYVEHLGQIREASDARMVYGLALASAAPRPDTIDGGGHGNRAGYRAVGPARPFYPA
jgi:hypothetical protein